MGLGLGFRFTRVLTRSLLDVSHPPKTHDILNSDTSPTMMTMLLPMLLTMLMVMMLLSLRQEPCYAMLCWLLCFNGTQSYGVR